jgi:hypothetical protein
LDVFRNPRLHALTAKIVYEIKMKTIEGRLLFDIPTYDVDWIQKEIPLPHPVFGELQSVRFADSVLAPPNKTYRLLERKRAPQPRIDVSLPLALPKQKLMISVWVDMEVLTLIL